MNRKASGCRCFVAIEKSELGKETLNLFDTWKLSMVNEGVVKEDDRMLCRSWHMCTEATQSMRQSDTKLCIGARAYLCIKLQDVLRRISLITHLQVSCSRALRFVSSNFVPGTPDERSTAQHEGWQETNCITTRTCQDI
jgi:hypothetical protein